MNELLEHGGALIGYDWGEFFKLENSSTTLFLSPNQATHGCIRARECSGANGKDCPVGIATMNKMKRSKFLIIQKSKNIAAYHDSLIKGVKALMAVMGKVTLRELSKQDLITNSKNKLT